MKRIGISVMSLALLFAPQNSSANPAAVAGGVIGGLAVLGIIGAAVHHHHKHHGYHHRCYACEGEVSLEAQEGSLRERNYQLKREIQAQQEEMAALSEEMGERGEK